MSSGLFIDNRRPQTKKAVKEAVSSNPESVYVESVSFLGNDFQGSITDLTVGDKVTFVGPDPRQSRKFYGTITRTAKGFKVS